MALRELAGDTADEKALLCSIIKKAKMAGFKFRNLIDNYEAFTITSFSRETGRLVIVLRNDTRHQVIYDSIYLLFFDLTFARALFGSEWEQHLIGLSHTSDQLTYIQQNVQLD